MLFLRSPLMLTVPLLMIGKLEYVAILHCFFDFASQYVDREVVCWVAHWERKILVSTKCLAEQC